MKKTIIILIFLSLILIDLIKPIYLSLWQTYWRKQIRRELKLEVKKNHLIKLTLFKQDIKDKKIILQFTKKDEFRYQHSMYDIVQVINNKDSITYICFLDLKEMLQIASVMNFKLNSGLLSPIIPILKSKLIQFYDYLPNNNFISLPNILIQFVFIKIKLHIVSREIKVITPPPK